MQRSTASSVHHFQDLLQRLRFHLRHHPYLDRILSSFYFSRISTGSSIVLSVYTIYRGATLESLTLTLRLRLIVVDYIFASFQLSSSFLLRRPKHEIFLYNLLLIKTKKKVVNAIIHTNELMKKTTIDVKLKLFLERRIFYDEV